MKVAVVTGATGGLGRSLASVLEQAGYFQILCGRTRGDIDSSLKTAAHVICWTDLSTWEGADALRESFEATQAQGLDLLVNCASITHQLKPMEALSREEISSVFATNVFSLFHIASWAVPLMRRRRAGLIVNISSYCGRRAVPNLSGYCSSKFAVRGFTEALAKELEGSGVRCVSVSPSGINTRMRTSLFGQEDAAKQMHPDVVAQLVRDIADGKLELANGDDVVIRRGRVRVIHPEDQSG